MSYDVFEVDAPQSPPAVAIERTIYPPEEIEDVISTEIILWEVDSNVGGYFSWNYWKSLFNMKKDYNIVLHQRDPISTKTICYLLHYTTDLEVAKTAYNRICNTVAPLVDDCTLLLSEELLEAVILPSPIKPSKLMRRISEVMELQPDAHSDWVKVLQALVLVAIKNDDDEACENVKDILGSSENSFQKEATDRVGNTALHLAKSGKHVSNLIRAGKNEEEKKRLVNQKNKEGKAPLHCAFTENKQDVVRRLIDAGADFEATTGEEGSNPLHMAAKSGSAESVRTAHQGREGFLKKDSEKNPEKIRFVNAMNAQDKYGRTPLMHAIRANFIDSTVTFLQAGALPNVKNSKTGDTALHYAAEMGLTSIVKALLAFGAEMEIKNNNGETPLMLACSSKTDGARESEKVLTEMIQLKKEAEAKMTKTFEPIEIPPNALFLLSMDGGGTRGLLLTQTLIAIQKRIKQLKPDCLPLHKYFDYIAGTSAGGLATLSIACAEAGLETTRSSFFKAGDEVCAYSPTFPDEVVNRSSMETYGKDDLMTDTKSPRVIVTTTLGNRNPPVLHLMCNYGEARNGQKPPSEQKVWETGRSTSAAPFYFPPHEDKFIDGGVMANNPTLDAMAEIVMQEDKEKSGHKLAMVVSLGTGVFPPAPKTDDVTIFVPNLSNTFKAIWNIRETMSAVVNFLHILINQATISNGQEVVRAEAWCKSLGIPYHRISPSLKDIVDLTENNKAVLTDMMLQGEQYLLRNADQVDIIARSLLSHRHRQ